MNATALMHRESVNGLDIGALFDTMRQIEAEPARGFVAFHVSTRWAGRGEAVTHMDRATRAGRRVGERLTLPTDGVLGGRGQPSPHELMLSAVNACLMGSYVIGAAMRGIAIESIEIETSAELDLRGLLGIDPTIAPNFEDLRIVIRVAADGSDAELADIHACVMKTAPNVQSVARPVRLDARLEIARAD